MNATVTLRKDGTILVPKAMREKLKLRGGSRLKVSFAPAPDEEEEEETVQIKRMPNGRRVIMGWEGFDAAKAVLEAREEHMQRLLGKSPQP